MYDGKYIVPGLLIFLAVFFIPTAYTYATGGPSQPPKPALPANETQCVESKDWMRDNHMQLLVQWREDVVRNNDRTYTSFTYNKQYKKSLTNTCLKCHDNKQDFCDSCHTYAGVSPNCWDCHNVPKEVSS
ncbi:MAG: sulfate reduction electron transfer complex DsrMKJOP subunit DsrJ [Chloroflexi bacterium]|nr:sulfate reduction electron transfer complex DsrMKJOP subunit DsrJ [Chloroflexota bacterium]MCL5107446.1 sulfate reduction electron transfer complex DsrMKJOP subunit DsrJ [Chloroflexota bacterium]